jgi:hypothetical protein
MVSVPLLGVPPLPGTVNETVPFPVPVAPDVMVIQAALLLAAHMQPVAVATFTVPEPPLSEMCWLVGEMPYEQARACVTVNAWPAMVSVPVRSAPAFAATVNTTEPLPVPLEPAVIAIHDVWLVAAQLHPADVVTLTGAPAPPVAAML